jgi:hypothetical protein
VLKASTQIAIFVAALSYFVPLTAQAADPAFCNGYATAAIN